MPQLIDLLMESKYENIINLYKNDEELKIIRLQLLFVKHSIKFLCIRDINNYMLLIGQISSLVVPIDCYRNAFINQGIDIRF